MGTHAERVADGVGQFGTVQRVEVELIDAMPLQHVHLLDRHRRGDELARLGIVFETVETVLQPVRDRRAATFGETRDLRESRDRQDTRHDRHDDSLGRAGIAETQEQFGVVEELRDRARRARIDLALEIVEVEFGADCFGVLSGYAATEISNSPTDLRPFTRSAAYAKPL